MKKITVALTAAALAATFMTSLTPSEAQTTSIAPTLSSLTAKGYDTPIASSSLAANTDAAALMAQINATRAANHLPVLQNDPSLTAAAWYQAGCEVKWRYSASYAILNEGTKAVYAQQASADFGSSATGVQEDINGNAFSLSDTDNFPALYTDWQNSDTNFVALLSNPNINVAGFAVIDTGSCNGTTHIYKWVLYVGNKSTSTPADTYPTLASMTAKGYDSAIASNALAANTDAAALMAQINATRAANKLPVLQNDPSLTAAAWYQAGCEVKWRYSASYAILNEGTKAVYAQQASADFGSSATGVQEDINGNAFSLSDTDNFPALYTDWQNSDTNFVALLSSPNVNVAGFAVIDTGTSNGATHIYKWVLYVGYNPNAVSTAPTGPKLNLTGLNPNLAQQALTATPSASELSLLAAINAYRTTAKLQTFTMEPELYAAAYYDMHDTGTDNTALLASDFGSLYSTYDPINGNSGLDRGLGLALYGNWPDMITIWRLDPTTQAFASLLANNSYSHCGLSIVDTGTKEVKPGTTTAYEVYDWTIIAAK